MNRIVVVALTASLFAHNAYAQQTQPTTNAETAPVKSESPNPGEYKADPQTAIEQHRKAFFERIQSRKSETPEVESK